MDDIQELEAFQAAIHRRSESESFKPKPYNKPLSEFSAKRLNKLVIDNSYDNPSQRILTERLLAAYQPTHSLTDHVDP
jgi:hypothetical protein